MSKYTLSDLLGLAKTPEVIVAGHVVVCTGASDLMVLFVASQLPTDYMGRCLVAHSTLLKVRENSYSFGDFTDMLWGHQPVPADLRDYMRSAVVRAIDPNTAVGDLFAAIGETLYDD